MRCFSLTRVDVCDACLLGAPLFHGSELDKSWNGCCDDLAGAAERLRDIGCQDALILLRSSFSAPKVLHLLRCAPSVSYAALETFDSLARLYSANNHLKLRDVCLRSQFLFSVFIDDLVKLVSKDNIGCRIGASCTAIFLYADDIILLAPSVQALQLLNNICISELNYLDMAINVKKNRLACVLFRDIKMSVLML